MKRLLLLIACMLNFIWASAQFSGSGSGTSNDPYKIYNPDQLSQVRNFLSTSGVYFKLMQNIDLTDWISENYPSQGWQPIGSSSSPFQGVFDGNGKSLTGFSINRSTADYVGFFAYTDGATIKNLTISGTVKGRQYTGSLIGYGTNTTISNYTFSSSVTSSGSYGGGVAGYFSGTATSLTVNAVVNGTGYLGGLFGQASGTITTATFANKVTGNSSYVGGAIGYSNGELSLNSCNVNSSVTGGSTTGGCIGQISGNGTNTIKNINVQGNIQGTVNLGGVVGYVSSSSNFTNIKHVGTVIGSSYNIGGLIGLTESNPISITTGKHEGDIKGTKQLGGAIGYVNQTTITLTSCYSDGNITGTGDGYIGGICGLLKNSSNSTISQCSSWGNISGKSYLGGIVGYIQNVEDTSIDLTSKIVASSIVSASTTIKAYTYRSLTKKSSFDYWDQSTGYYWLISVRASDSSEGYDVSIGQHVSADLYESSNLEDNLNFYDYTGLQEGEKVSYRVGYSSKSSSYSSSPFYAGNGEFYLNIINGTTTSSMPVSISNSSAVGNIISNSSSGNYLGGIVGKDESNYTCVKVSSRNYYYFPYNGTKQTVDLFAWDATYQAQFIPMEPVTLTTYKRSYNASQIEGSYFSGSLQGNEYVGGIAGYKENGTVVKNYSNAKITGNKNVGGLIGRLVQSNEDTGNEFKANVSLNSSIFATESSVGRIYGTMSGNFPMAELGTNEENRALASSTVFKNGVAQIINDNLQNGTAVGVSQLRYKANYVAWGWDFNNNWTILDTESFPYKIWQTAPPTFSGKPASGATTISGNSVDGGTVTVITNDANNTYTANASNNTWSVTLNTGLHSNEAVQAYAQKTGLEKSYMTITNAGVIGSGTPDDPYLIYNAYDLAAFSKEGNYKLMNDIDLTSWINENSPITGWVPVGISSVSDSIVFEGDNHKITGLWSKTASSYAGLFSNIAGSNSIIRNLNLEGVDINTNTTGSHIGGLVGNMDGSIIGCTVTGSVKGNGDTGLLAGAVGGSITGCSVSGTVTGNGNNAGLLAGQVSSPVTDCTANGSVSGSAQYMGGMIGSSTTSLSKCYARVTVVSSSTSSSPCAGGLCGRCISSSYITLCSVDGIIRGDNLNNVGGLCGYSSSSVINECKTNVTVSGGIYAGGLCGQISQTVVTRSLSSGSVTGGKYVGGLIGYTSASISDCYSTADATATSETAYAGGIVGYTSNQVSNCYATGNITSTTKVAGVVCYLYGSNAITTNCVAINNTVSATSESGTSAMRVIGGYTNGAADPEQTCMAYKDMAVSVNNVPQRIYDDPLNGTSMEMATLKLQDTYTGLGWNFSTVWYMNSDTGFPDFIWNRNNEAPSLKYYYEEAELSEWSINNSEALQRNTWSGENDASGIRTPFIEAWKLYESGYLSDGEISHNTIYLTPGSYTVTILARMYNEGNSTEYPSGITFYANDASVDLSEIGTKSSYTGVHGPSYLVYANISVDCTVGSDGKLDLGFMLEDVVGNWLSFKDLQITPKEDGDDNKETQSIELTQIPAMTYGDANYTLPQTTDQGQTLTWSSSNENVAIVSGNTLTVKGAGTATITASQEGNDTYSSFSKTFEVAIAKAPLTITAENKSKQVGSENPELTVSYSGFVNGENASSLTTQPTITTTALTDSPVGTYPITASGAASSNYEITYVAGTLTVTDAPVVEEDTDISQIDNVVYITPFEAYGGDEVTLSIKMKNNVGIQTVQFDMYLPEGVEVVEDEDEFELIELSTERTTARKMNQFSVVQTSGGAYRVLINSTGGYTFDGNDGEIATAQIKLADDITPGDYPMIFRDIVLVTTSSEGFETDYVKFTLTVPDYMLGDVNSDRKVNAIDLNAITNYILEHRTFPFTFNTRAGDVNSDTKINAIDLNAVTNMILHQSSPAGIKLRAIEVGTFDE